MGSSMIARIWKGRVLAKDYEAYTQFMIERAIPDYQQTTGFVKLSFLRQLKGEEGHFTLITYWENLEVIKNFAGAAYETAKYYPEDVGFLLEMPSLVEHYEVFGEV